MTSKIYQEVEWVCTKCNHRNVNTFLEIETHPVECVNCSKSFDIFLKVNLDIKVLQVSDGTVSEEDKRNIKIGLKRASDLGKMSKCSTLEIMSEINSALN